MQEIIEKLINKKEVLTDLPEDAISGYTVRNAHVADLGGHSMCALMEVWLPHCNMAIYPFASEEAIGISLCEVDSELCSMLDDMRIDRTLISGWYKNTSPADFGKWETIIAQIYDYCVAVGISSQGFEPTIQPSSGIS